MIHKAGKVRTEMRRSEGFQINSVCAMIHLHLQPQCGITVLCMSLAEH